MLKCSLTFTPPASSLPAPSSRSPGRDLPVLCPGSLRSDRDHRVPRAPLPGMGVTHHQSDLEDHLRGRYPSFIAPTDPCARPPTSERLGCPLHARSLQVAASPCWLLALPDIISAIFVEVLGPIPRRVRQVLLPISSLTTAASRHGKRVRHTSLPLLGDFCRERTFEAAVIRSPSGSPTR